VHPESGVSDNPTYNLCLFVPAAGETHNPIKSYHNRMRLVSEIGKFQSSLGVKVLLPAAVLTPSWYGRYSTELRRVRL